MKKQYNQRYDETYYSEVLNNGLEVVVWHKPDFQNSYFFFATGYGALDFKQVNEQGNIIEFPSGIAHFLEHKMFESEQGDVMDRFSQLGANVNAFTSYNETVYYFSSTNKSVSEEVNLLLDFVQKLEICPKSVEKEKEIIVQELNMYLQMPDSRLLFESFKSMYHKHPLRMDIGGSPDSVRNTTKDDLERCHAINYHPSKMIFVAITCMDPESIFALVKENQSKKTFTEAVTVKTMVEEEPFEVKRKSFSLPMDVAVAKSSIAFKLVPEALSVKERVKKEWAIRFLLESYFSNLNPEYQRWLDEGIINDFFNYEIDLGKDYAFLLFYAEMEKDELKLFILKQLELLKEQFIEKDILEQIKRRYYGMYVRVFDHQENIALQYIRNSFMGLDVYDVLAIIESISLDDIERAWDSLRLDNYCLTEIIPKI